MPAHCSSVDAMFAVNTLRVVARERQTSKRIMCCDDESLRFRKRCPGLFQIRDSPWHSCATGSCAWQCRPRTSAIMDRRHSMLEDTKYGVATYCPGITGPIHQTAKGPVEAAKRRGEIREHLVEAAPVFPSWGATGELSSCWRITHMITRRSRLSRLCDRVTQRQRQGYQIGNLCTAQRKKRRVARRTAASTSDKCATVT